MQLLKMLICRLHSVQQKENSDDIEINPGLIEAQTAFLQDILDVPTVTHLVEHKVKLSQTEQNLNQLSASHTVDHNKHETSC